MQQNHKQCLLLNADYTPLGIISWQKAIIWSMRFNNNPKYSIEIIDFYKNDHINGVDKKYPIPAVAKINRFFKINNQAVTFSRKNIFIRDDYSCQYCGKKYELSYLIYDYVIFKSKWRDNKGSPTCWTNIVTHCTWCNRRKGNKTASSWNMDDELLFLNHLGTWADRYRSLTVGERMALLNGYRRGLALRTAFGNLDPKKLDDYITKELERLGKLSPNDHV